MSVFLLSIKGQVESVALPDCDELFLKYQFVYGEDWVVTVGFEEGLTQVSKRYDYDDDFIFAFPIDATFKSTNPKGWPQMVFCAYGRDIWGHEVLRGYGVTTIPVSAGSNIEKTVGLFTPENSNLISRLSSWISGRRPELQDPRLLARNRGREVLQTSSKGCLKLMLNLIHKDISTMGYQTVPASSSEQLDLPAPLRITKPPRIRQQKMTSATQFPIADGSQEVAEPANISPEDGAISLNERFRRMTTEEIEPVASTSHQRDE